MIGLLTAPDGTPVAVRVFADHTQDPKTVAEQVRTVSHSFGVKEVTLVGDRGMLKQPQLALLNEEEFHYITAITKPQIRKLIAEGVLQMSLFDEELGEVEVEQVRYILRRNPKRAREMAQNRQDKLASWQGFLAQQNRYLTKHPRAKLEVAHRKVVQRAKGLKIDPWLKVTMSERTPGWEIDEQAQKRTAQLDGCYVIKKGE